jgi:transcriptional regulator with XRE-family HTH domain
MPTARAPIDRRTPSIGAGLGTWIRGARASQGISQRGLADRSGLSRSYLCDIERGRGAQPSVATLDKLATALGANRAELLRAAGVLEPLGEGGSHEREAERRLLALYRDLSPEGRDAVERFVRFTHREEHRWVQPVLSDRLAGTQGADGEEAGERPVRSQGGPTLFDGLDGVDGPSRVRQAVAPAPVRRAVRADGRR